MVMSQGASLCKSSDPFASRPMSVNSTVGYEIQEFLAWEALLLDRRRYGEWRDLLDANLVYRCPGRPDDERSYNFTLWHLRRQRVCTPEEAPLAPTHRFVGNVIVMPGDSAMEFVVASYVIVNYSNPEEPERSFAVDRCDVLRKNIGNRFQILRREIRMGWISPASRELIGPL